MAKPLAIVLPIRFHEAIRAAERRKVVLPDKYYGELQAAARTEAFTISGLAGVNQISAALEALNEGLRQGMTFAEWKTKALAEGWMLTPAHLELVLRAHTQAAYMRGQYEQAKATKDRRPYLMYTAINDHRARPTHLAMDGIIRHFDDSFWDTHFPPCGFNCRCGVITLTEAEARDRGGPTTSIPIEARADPGWGLRPARSTATLDTKVERRALDLPEPLQDAVKEWHETIKAEKMVDRVRDTIDEYDLIAKRVNKFVRSYGGLVAEHEAVAIYAYTMNKYFPKMNAYLRGTASAPLNLMATVAAANSGLAKMTAFDGIVYRGTSLSRMTDKARFLKNHVAGEVVEYQAFTSASYGVGFGGDVLYTIRSRNGRVVEGLSAHSVEKEVLFPPTTQFKILKVETRHGTTFIEMEELVTREKVPESHQFADDEEPKRGQASDLLDRMENESQFADPEVMARFRREHDGLTPIQYAMKMFPSAALEVEQAFPDLVPPKNDDV